jgi:hypothetical protein
LQNAAGGVEDSDRELSRASASLLVVRLHTIGQSFFLKILHSYRVNIENPKINLGDVLLLHFFVFYFITST